MEFIQPPSAPAPPAPDFRQPQPYSSQRSEVELKDGICARRTQKAGREKLRRDRVNEQFVELGNVVDPSRPKNDRATIIVDTIQLLKDLTSQINKLKGEHATLTEESRELMQEKNDIKGEKVALKSDIENLNVQYQQRLRPMFPWAAMDQTVILASPSYQFPVPMPMPMPAGPIPMHPSMQPYPFFGNQNPGVVPNPCSTFVPYVTPHTLVEQQSIQHIAPPVNLGKQSPILGRQDLRKESSEDSKMEKREDSNNVTTDLELKTPGSTEDEDLSPGQKKSSKCWREENIVAEESSSSRCSSSHSIQDSSSNTVVGDKKVDDGELRKIKQG